MPVGVRLRHTPLRHDSLPQLLSWYADQTGAARDAQREYRQPIDDV